MHSSVPTILCATMCSATALGAKAPEETKAVGLFFQTVSPTQIWGRNGILTTPSAVTVGSWHLTAESSIDFAGRVQKETMLDIKESVTLTTGGEVEVGYTRKDLIWAESFERTPLGATILHAKYTALDIKGDAYQWFPKVGVGAFGYQVNNQDDFDLGDAFVDLFVVASEIIEVPFFVLRLHAGANIGLLGSSSTKPYLFGGLDVTVLNGWLTLAAEHVGASRSGFDGVTNAGVAVNLFGLVQVGAMMYNLLDHKQSKWAGNLAVSIPFGAAIDQILH